MKHHWTSLVTYLAAIGCASYLVAIGKLPGEVLGALLGAALPLPWQRRE